eukprot:m.4984 g.4984  ORF g.4984 m.4984 type:complete len:235 (+) comp2750_c0_seq1:49-753(+)
MNRENSADWSIDSSQLDSLTPLLDDSHAPQAEHLQPVTVWQLRQAVQEYEDAPFVLDGKALSMVQLVGTVEGCEESLSCITYTVRDHTGSIEVLDWNRLAAPIRAEGRPYVKVFGGLRSFGDGRMIDAACVLRMADGNELTAHLLEVIHSHLVQTHPAAKSPQKLPSKPQAHTRIEQEVMSVFAQADAAVGLAFESICRTLLGIASRLQVREALESLCDKGLMYTTQHDHFKMA